MLVNKYKSKPKTIEAVQFTGDIEEIEDFVGYPLIYHDNLLSIPSLGGVMSTEPGDYIIKDIEGEFYSCRSDIFEKSYELVGEGE